VKKHNLTFTEFPAGHFTFDIFIKITVNF